MHELGVLIESKYRGMGYAGEAFKLMLKHVFEDMGVEMVHNCFEDTRTAPVRAHLSVGFIEYKRENGIIEFILTKEKFH